MIKKSNVTISNVTNWINNYNTYLIENNLIRPESIKTTKSSTKNLILSLIKNPDNFTFNERFWTFRNSRSGNDIFASYALAILQAADENDLYLQVQEMTY